MRDWSCIHVYWVDERLVPIDDPRSNYKLARDAWPLPDANVHRVLTELPPEEAARRYDSELQAVGRFDVIHRGMGSDGHTASLFPGDPLIHDREGYAAVAAGTPPRVTMLPRVLEAAHHTCVLATGVDKREMLAKVLKGPYDPLKYPAQIGAAGAVWYVDKEAHPC
jgi:6-phosphogluconolactonase